MMQRFCKFIFFRLMGWRMLGEPPKDLDKYLFVALPHTSNWDFVLGWLASKALDIKITFFVKDVFCKGPLICCCRFFGVAPVNRRERTNFVDSVAQQFAEHEKLVVLITPEGTRKYKPELKSGYYYLSKKAKVPIVLAGPNYADKTFTLLPPRPARETFEEDQAELIAFCKTMHGKRPDNTFS